ncbi:helix-turn-helix domain-containing protein [Halobacillus seohaensis]|uniref:DUF3967 domain-containing protein n=1 Tax=Halobacillus seohaensis TaxID=447421 RepID=A0ABW2ETB1_9BACI
MEKWLSVSEVMERSGLTESTARRYIRNHQRFLKVRKGKRKSYQIHESELDIIKQIRDWYGEGKGIDDVDELLQDQGITMTVTVNDGEKEVEQTVSEALSELKKSMDEQKEFNKKLLEELDKRDRYISEKLDKRDEQLMNVMNESMEAKKQIATAAEAESVHEEEQKDPEKKKSFFSRLFNK